MNENAAPFPPFRLVPTGDTHFRDKNLPLVVYWAKGYLAKLRKGNLAMPGIVHTSVNTVVMKAVASGSFGVWGIVRHCSCTLFWSRSACFVSTALVVQTLLNPCMCLISK